MNDLINIKCQSCSKNNAVARIKLSQHWGRKIGIPCNHCKHQNNIIVNADLMSGKPPIVENASTRPPFHERFTEFTEGINSNDANYKIATLQVLTNEHNKAQSFTLKEGEYIIGRQSDDDGGILNKIRIKTTDTKMSRNHCQLTVVKKADMTFRYILTDLNSVNGTHINTNNGSKKLDQNEKIVVQIGDIVGLGYRTQIKLIE